MTPSLLDLSAPLFAWIDAVLGAVLPPLGRLALWAVAAGVISMALYCRLSPQRTLARLKHEAIAARADLAGYEGDLRGLWPRIGRALRLAGQQLGLTLGSALIASVPVLMLMVWLSTTYAYSLPEPGTSLAVTGIEDERTVAIGTVAWPTRGESIALHDPSGLEIAALPLREPVPVVHKRYWWNAIIGNPAGYLPDAAAVDRITLDLPKRSYVAFGPGWMRGWEAVFLLGLLASSLVVKLAFGIK